MLLGSGIGIGGENGLKVFIPEPDTICICPSVSISWPSRSRLENWKLPPSVAKKVPSTTSPP